MRLVRKKFLENLDLGKEYSIKKISDPEFIIYAKREMNLLFAEAVTEKNPEKFADLIELINSICEMLKIDFFECTKIRSDKRWKYGKFDCILASKATMTDLGEESEN